MNDAREAAPATGARPPAAHSPWRIGWHTGYYVLVVLNLATLSLGLYQNHRILTRNKQSAVFNQQWAERIDSYGALARLAAAANAPGTDVFATKDVEGEAAARRRRHEKNVLAFAAPWEWFAVAPRSNACTSDAESCETSSAVSGTEDERSMRVVPLRTAAAPASGPSTLHRRV